MRGVLSFALIACIGGAELACSGSSSSAPSGGEVNLVIGGLATAFPGSSCTREFPGTRGAAGTTLFLTFTYSAPLGNLTGGRVLYLDKADSIRPVIESIRTELAKQYYVGYYAARRPGLHHIRVEVPGQALRIRSKTEYMGS